MSAQHTQGLLHEPCAFGASRFELQGGGRQIAVVNSQADARRIRACWNCLDGISTDDIENTLSAGGFMQQEGDLAVAIDQVEGLKEHLRWALGRIRTSKLGEGEHFAKALAMLEEVGGGVA